MPRSLKKPKQSQISNYFSKKEEKNEEKMSVFSKPDQFEELPDSDMSE